LRQCLSKTVDGNIIYVLGSSDLHEGNMKRPGFGGILERCLRGGNYELFELQWFGLLTKGVPKDCLARGWEVESWLFSGLNCDRYDLASLLVAEAFKTERKKSWKFS